MNYSWQIFKIFNTVLLTANIIANIVSQNNCTYPEGRTQQICCVQTVLMGSEAIGILDYNS
jgi:hypothetical protein